MGKKYKDTFQLLAERRTTFEFSKRKVSENKIRRIIEAGRLSPSSHNCQPWSFILVKNKHTIETLMRTYSYGVFYGDPPVIIAVVLEKIYKNQKGLLAKKLSQITLSHKYLNIGFATSNIVTEAESLGLNTCILSPIVRIANKILKVPSERETLLLIGIGYRQSGSLITKKDRKPLKEVLMREKYRG